MGSIEKLIKNELAIAVNGDIQFSESSNMFFTQGFTSYSGNTYFKGFRFSDKIMITIEIGIGYKYEFLNGITVFAKNGDKNNVLGSRSFHCYVYAQSKAKAEAKEIIIEHLKKKSLNAGMNCDEYVIEKFSNGLIEETNKNQKDVLSNIQFNKLLNS